MPGHVQLRLFEEILLLTDPKDNVGHHNNGKICQEFTSVASQCISLSGFLS